MSEYYSEYSVLDFVKEAAGQTDEGQRRRRIAAGAAGLAALGGGAYGLTTPAGKRFRARVKAGYRAGMPKVVRTTKGGKSTWEPMAAIRAAQKGYKGEGVRQGAKMEYKSLGQELRALQRERKSYGKKAKALRAKAKRARSKY